MFGVLPLIVVGMLIGFFAAYSRMSRDDLLVLMGIVTPFAAWIWVCLGARRLHDIGVSGWWMLLVLVLPFAVSFLLSERLAQLPALLATIVLGAVPGDTGVNRFGDGGSAGSTQGGNKPGLPSNNSLERTREG
jgi:uncharacterized membrane protein YhaH (DUF805 family)